MKAAAIILAAGQGQRMRSNIPKALHKIAGVPMVEQVLNSVKASDRFKDLYLVIGHQGELVKAAVSDVNFVVQEEQLGTGHAVDQCRHLLQDFRGPVLVTYVDTPLFRPETFRELLVFHEQQKLAATVITAELTDPTGYGRIVRGQDDYLIRIVEQKDATIEEQKITEINTGTYCFDSELLFKYLSQVTPDNAQSEYYLPDVIPLMIQDGYQVGGFRLADPQESMGINDRIQLAQAEEIMRQRICREHMLAGVSIVNPSQTYIEQDCQIGQDTIIYPNAFIERGTIIGSNCVIGSNVRLTKANLADHVQIEQAVVVESSVGNNTVIGPFAYIRPGSKIGSDCKIGDFVEIKNTSIGHHSKVPHHSYIGDAEVGSGVNIGCGTITCNYDGKAKSKTIIHDQAFIGSNTSLVAPVTVGEGAYVAAGSTITEHVPAGSLGIARARQVNKKGWKKTEG